MKKRLVVVLLMLCIVLSMVPALPDIALASGDTWEDRRDVSIFADKNQMEYVITTPEQLAGFAYTVNNLEDSFFYKTVKLGADIDLAGYDWVPIDHSGSSTGAGFWGTFDGANYKIRNMTITKNYEEAGFFGHCDGAIKNVTLENLSIDTKSPFVGGICGGLITTSKSIMGTVENCSASGTIHHGLGDVGELVGYIYPGATVNGTNPGTLRVVPKYWSYAADTSIFEDNSQSTYNIYTAEQLAGFALMLNTWKTTFENKTIKLMNNIDLSAYEWVPANRFRGTFDGGGHAVFGMRISGDAATKNVGFFGAFQMAAVRNFTVSGDIDVVNAGYTGLLAGEAIKAIINSCASYGSVKSDGSSVGGLVGVYSALNSGVANCANAARVEGNGTYVGGLFGGWAVDDKPGKVYLYNCTNLGSIYGSAQYMGGLLGRFEPYYARNFDPSQSIYIQNCSVPYGVIIDGTGKNGRSEAGGFIGELRLPSRKSNTGSTTQLVFEHSYSAVRMRNVAFANAVAAKMTIDTFEGEVPECTKIDLSNSYSFLEFELANCGMLCNFGRYEPAESTKRPPLAAYDFYLLNRGASYNVAVAGSGGAPFNDDDFKRYAYYYYAKDGDRERLGSTTPERIDLINQLSDQAFDTGRDSFDWETIQGANNGYPVLKDDVRRNAMQSLYATGNVIVSGDERASLEKTPYNGLKQQPQANKDTGLIMRFKRKFAGNLDLNSFEKITFGTPLPNGTTVTLRKIKEDFSGYEAESYTYKVTDAVTTEITLDLDPRDGGNNRARLTKALKETAYDVFFTFDDASFDTYETTYTFSVTNTTSENFGPMTDKIVVKKIHNADVAFTYDDGGGEVTTVDGGPIASGTPVQAPVGSDQRFLIQPKPGRTVQEVQVNGVTAADAVPLSGGWFDLKNIQNGTDISVTFGKRVYNVTLDAVSSVSADTDPAIPVQKGLPATHGSDFDFKVFAKPGYAATPAVEVKANGTVLTSDSNGLYKISNITQNTVITVTGFVPDKTPPVVASVSQTGAAESGAIAVAFNKPMNTAAAGMVWLNDLPALSTGTWSADGKTYSAPYTDLAGRTTYTVHIEAFKDFAGNVMAKDSSHTFTTDMASPGVLLTIAPDNTQPFPSPIILTATISGTHTVTGTVTFFESAPDASGTMVEKDVSGPIPVSGNAAVFIRTQPELKEYLYQAKYSGDTGNNPADSPQMSYTVSKDMGTITLSDISKVYDGAPASAPKITASSTGAVSVEYLVDGAYTADPPVNAGVYTVRVRVAADERYNEAMVSQAFSISQADPQYTAPDYFLVSEGSVLGDIDLSAYNVGGTFVWKTPEADVGAAGSTAEHELVFLPDDGVNYKTAAGIMVPVEVRRMSITPRAEDSTASGIKKSYQAGETISFTAVGSGMDNVSPLSGDRRWRPISWKCNPEGVFADGNYTASFVLDTAGNYTLSVLYEEQEYDGTNFVATGNTYTSTTALVVNAPTAEQPSRKAAPATGDDSNVTFYGLLALLSACILAAATKKKRCE